jgi:hypothetical protein
MTNENRNGLLLLKYIPYLLLIPICLLILFIVLFVGDFPSYLGTEKSWLNTSQILNALLTPILTLASIILIALTWLTTKKEMETTRNQLAEQILYQRRKDEIDLVSRQALNLATMINKNQKVADLLDAYTLKEVLGKIYLLKNTKVERFFERLNIIMDKENLTKNDYVNLIYEEIASLTTTTSFLIIRGATIKTLMGKKIDPFIMFKTLLKHDTPIKDILFDIFSILYTDNIKEATEARLFYLLLDKVEKCDEKYRADVKQELSLSFDNYVAEALILLNPDLPNNILDFN